jgi:hypothetical protein
MVDNQHRKISGYRDLSEAEIEAINGLKEMEKKLNQILDSSLHAPDPRHLAIAKTHLETGFM